MSHREVMQQALEALEHAGKTGDWIFAGAAINALRAALAEPQEPVAWRYKDTGHFTASQLVSKFSEWQPLYTHPAPQRQPLTGEHLRKMHHEDQFGLFCDYDDFEQIARAVEAAHRIGGQDE